VCRDRRRRPTAGRRAAGAGRLRGGEAATRAICSGRRQAAAVRGEGHRPRKKNGENGLTSVGPDGRRERVRGGTAVVLRQTQFFSPLHSF
jgi:hypothetical protein